MTILSEPSRWVIGLGLVVALTLAVSGRAHAGEAAPEAAEPSSDGWTCQWLEPPTIHRGAPHSECRGVVQCRHLTLQTLIPQVRKVTCPVRDGECSAAACFTQALRAR